MSLDLTILLRHNEMVAMGQSNCHKLICFGDGRIWGVQPCLLLANDASSGRDTLSWFSLTLVGPSPIHVTMHVQSSHRATISGRPPHRSPSRRNPCSILPIARREKRWRMQGRRERRGEEGRRDKKGHEGTRRDNPFEKVVCLESFSLSRLQPNSAHIM